MKVWSITSFGVDKLQQIEAPGRDPAAHEVLVKVHAVSLNYRDLLMVKGHYNPKMALPRIPCSDGAGEVIAVGEGVSRWKVGDRVAGIFFQSWIAGRASKTRQRGALGGDVDGMLAQQVILHEEGLVAVPQHLTYEEASTLPCAGLTAWNAVMTVAQTKPGDTVLIQGTGGVSLFALQFAKLAGARVLGTSGSDEKLERAREFGLDSGLNYKKTPDWSKWAFDETGGDGVDLVVEVGGAGTFQQSLQAVGIGGTVATIGILSGIEQPLQITPILHKQINVQGIYVGSRDQFEEMNRAISLNRLKPVVDEVFPFAAAREALKTMEAATHFGKIVISAVS